MLISSLKTEEDEEGYRAAFSMFKSLIIEYATGETDLGTLLVSHAEKCRFYCTNNCCDLIYFAKSLMKSK